MLKKSILDKSFVYVPSRSSDIRKTFERVKREIDEARKAKLDQAAQDLAPVLRIFEQRRKGLTP